MKKRNASLGLLLLLAALTVSCGGQTAAETATEPLRESEPAETETVTEFYQKDNLPELDFGGTEVKLYAWDGAANNEFFADADGDIVHDAIFERNKRVEERMNIKLSHSMEMGDNANRAQWVKTLQSSVLAGDGTYDISAGYSMCGASLANAGLVQDLAVLPYLDFAAPWWPDSMISESTCGGKLYFASGDISMDMIDYIYAVFFNKDILTSYDLGNPYPLVTEGKWTLDAMMEMSRDLYKDLDGDAKKGLGDQYGYLAYPIYVDVFFFSSGLRTTELGADGIPALSPMFGSEKTQALLEKLNGFFKTNDAYLNDTSDIDGTKKIFTEGRALFFTMELQYAGKNLRDANMQYGVLPVPKYDEAQEDYYTVCSFPYTLYGIPIDAKNPEMSAAVMECLASESYRTVSPALFETAMKVKYMNDPDASEMFDIIRSSVVFDFGRIFNDNMSSMTYSLFRESVTKGDSNWISKYEKNKKSLEKALTKIIDALTGENG